MAEGLRDSGLTSGSPALERLQLGISLGNLASERPEGARDERYGRVKEYDPVLKDHCRLRV